MSSQADIDSVAFDAAVAARDAALFSGSPHVVLKPKIYPDGDMWCALLGEDLKMGVSGFGETPIKACSAFDQAWYHQRTPAACFSTNTVPQGAGETAGGERGAFEKWITGYGFSVAPHRPGHPTYAHAITGMAWNSWQASRKAAIATAAPEQAGSREIVRHVKRGKRGPEFEVLGEARGFQLDEYGEPHPHNLTVYRKVGSDHLAWMLPNEFRVHFAPAAARPRSDAEGRS